VIDYALGNLRRPRHSLSSRTLFKLVLLLSAAPLGSSADAQQATKIPKVGGRRRSAQSAGLDSAALMATRASKRSTTSSLGSSAGSNLTETTC